MDEEEGQLQELLVVFFAKSGTHVHHQTPMFSSVEGVLMVRLSSLLVYPSEDKI